MCTSWSLCYSIYAIFRCPLLSMRWLACLKTLYVAVLNTRNQNIVALRIVPSGVALAALCVGFLIYAIRLSDPGFQSFLLYNLPDGLWAFGFAGLLLLVFRTARSVAWLGGLVLLGMLGELLQSYQIIPGTFDPMDIFCYLGGVTLAILCHLFLHHKTTKP